MKSAITQGKRGSGSMKETVDEIRYSKSAAKYIRSQTAKTKSRLKEIIEIMADTIKLESLPYRE